MTDATGVEAAVGGERRAGSVTWRRLPTGGFEVDHALPGSGFTRVAIATEAAVEYYATAILDTEARAEQ